MYRFFLKRVFDLFCSFLGLILLSPIFLVLFLVIKIDSKGPIFFRQERVGKHKKIFKIHKFRTMRTDAPHDMPTHLLKDPDAYITKVGRFLRKTSLDELPQIWDIFVGKMSIIGPRPALWNQDDLVAARDCYADKRGRTVNDLTPGLTGWAQIHGRDELEISEKAKLDGYYLQNIGFIMDVKCFFGTIKSVLKSDGVHEGGPDAEQPGNDEDDENACAASPDADICGVCACTSENCASDGENGDAFDKAAEEVSAATMENSENGAAETAEDGFAESEDGTFFKPDADASGKAAEEENK